MKFTPLAVLCTLALPVLAAEKVTYNEHIRPILSENCFACHGKDEKKREAGRRLDTAAGALAERDGFRAIVPGKLAESELWLRITNPDADEIMPPPDSHKKPLNREQRELIKTWIEQGAAYQDHWAFEPVARPALPPPAGGADGHPVDRFIGAKLAPLGLALAPTAARTTLLRRVTLDLTGLPPTVPELDGFLADPAPDAYERAVARLLASPRFGEHFGRHWLDAVRYGDSHGLHLDNIRHIWPYRDWVVKAFNRNLPFDQFTIEQLAGDLLPNPTTDQLVASGYNRNHLTTSEGGAIEDEVEARNTTDRLDTTAAVWLGLTVGCAACHDHKFDPLTQREYYSMGAFFKGLADRMWDGNMARPGPLVFVGTPDQEQRLKEIHAQLPALEQALSARAAELFAAEPPPPKGKMPVAYDVVWAEDGDLPTPRQFGAPPPPGQWQAGAEVPVWGGQRALRLEGAVERPVTFATGEVPLLVRKSATAFVHLHPDPARPPRAVSLEFMREGKTARRFVWGDASAFGPEIARDAIVLGPMPAAGAYSRLELEACDAGIEPGEAYTGVRLAQSDGAAWWDRIGAHCVTPTVGEDPLLSKEAWTRAMAQPARNAFDNALPHEILYPLAVGGTFQTDAHKQQLIAYHRDYIYGPLRGALEPEAHAARRLLAERVHYEMTLPASLISEELAEPRPQHVLIRGQYDKPGERVEAGIPAFLPPLQQEGARATRLDLARWLVDGRNPLTPRVTVNRLWQQLFGAGLVRTPNDLGVQGAPPTHAELLDWLADEFRRTGWDVKKFVTLLVTSRAYRQDSAVPPALLERDPENKLLARGPRFRLDAEVLRDQALAVSGLLRPEMGGPPVKPYQPTNIWEPVAYGGSNTRSYVPDQGDGLYRRSLYTFWKRTAPPPSMTTFDAPSREMFCVGRGRSNTPLQALALMNDVQHFEAARAFAERLLGSETDDARRLSQAFRSVTARLPVPAESQLLAQTLATHRAHFAADPDAARKILTNGESQPAATLPPAETAAWTMVSNLLLNLDETLTRD
ncbi:MAG: hypothetical protein RIQ93_251 [Verrucomicrobiota bacterium]|jgi:mono/diheme cytochrome c family protein